MAHILDLPREIYVIIFKHVLDNVTQEKFYSLSRVCKRWKDIVKDCFFWINFDGSINQKNLLSLSRNGSLVKTEQLTYSSVLNLKCSTAEEVFEGTPNLKSVNLSKVKILQSEILLCLHKHCEKLCAVKFSDDLNYSKYVICDDFIDAFLSFQGDILLVIDLSNLEMKNTVTIFRAIAESCPNLEELIVENVKTIGPPLFPLKDFQQGCNKIKVLRLGFPIYFSRHGRNNTIGFPMLEIFAHPSGYDWKFTDNDVLNILSKSPNLKILDIRGCYYISEYAILSLPATRLEYLYVSSTRLVNSRKLGEILLKWSRSLCLLDISKMTLESINEMLTSLSSKGKMINLKYLDLSNTKVNFRTVIHLIENCDELTTLNLSSCRSVGRGCMREYCTKTELNELHSKLLCRTEC